MSQSNLIFEIRELICGYRNKPNVLLIEHLDIERSKVYFIIGPSGVGKSTFIEALGLMNDTISSKQSKSLNYYNKQNEVFPLLDIWSKDALEITNFRKNYFSFLFQNNFLMPNFTAGENMLFTSLLKGEHQTVAIQNIKQLMHDIDLNSDLFDREVSSLSGGQKQRVAFVRSLIVESEVLFADEPTGNLDPLTSRKMMRLLKNEIVKHNRTALIVSHDIHLAMEFADIIVPIKLKNIENGVKVGTISSEEIFYNDQQQWKDHKGIVVDSMANTLLQSFQTTSNG